jgi:hypothetical protein
MLADLENTCPKQYTWPGSNWRPSACEADVIATRPQVLMITRTEALLWYAHNKCHTNSQVSKHEKYTNE